MGPNSVGYGSAPTLSFGSSRDLREGDVVTIATGLRYARKTGVRVQIGICLSQHVSICQDVEVSINGNAPKTDGLRLNTPLEWDDLGVPPLMESLMYQDVWLFQSAMSLARYELENETIWSVEASRVLQVWKLALTSKIRDWTGRHV